MNRALIACFVMATAALAAPPEAITGKVVSVHDGDTFTLLTEDKAQVKIRLEGIDAPEAKQPFGAQARNALAALIAGKQVVVHPTGKDRYKRTLGRAESGGTNIGLRMVKDGFAWHFDKYSKDATLRSAQAEAKAASRGLWRDADPVPPWEFRKQ